MFEFEAANTAERRAIVAEMTGKLSSRSDIFVSGLSSAYSGDRIRRDLALQEQLQVSDVAICELKSVDVFMLDSLLGVSQDPVWLVLVVIVSTFMLEDLAIMGAAILAASQKLQPELAFAATCTGMFIGDTALYLTGRGALIWPWLKKKLDYPLIQRQIRPLQKAPWHQLALIRCMPGLRTFGYIACGLARVPGSTFTIANVISIVLWAAALFGVTYWLGSRFAEQMHEWIWWLLPIALVVFVLGQKKIKQQMV